MHLLLLSKNRFLYSTRRLAEAALSRGWDVIVLDPRAAVIGIDASGSALLASGEEIADVNVVLPRVAPWLVDECAPVLAWAESRGIPTLTDERALRMAADKTRTLIALQSAGIAVPDSVFVAHGSQLASALAALGGAPIVAKTVDGSQGKGVALLDTAIAAKSACEALLGAYGMLLLQRFEADASGKDVRAFIIKSKVVGCVERTAASGDFRANVHQGGVGRVTTLSSDEELMVLEAAKALGVSTLAGVDFLRTNTGPKVLEVNASPGIEGIEDVLKLDLASQIVDACADLARGE